MIKVFKSALVLGALFFLGSCTTESLEVPEGTNLIEFYSLGVNQQVNPDDQPTKAGIGIQSTQIVDGATVGIFAYQTSGTALTNAVNNPHEVAYYTTDDDQTRAKLNPTDKKIAWPSNDSEDPVNVRAYAPYQSANAALDALTFTVQADQSTEAGYIASDFLYAKVNECKAVNGGVDLMFDHLFTKVVFYLYEGNSSVVLEGATVKLNNVAKTAQINLASGSIESTSNKGDITIHTFPADQSSDYVCSAIFPAHSFAAAKFMTITDVNDKEYTVSLGNKTFASGKVYTYGVNVKTAMEIYPTAITNWEEGHGDLNVGGGDIQSMTFMSNFAEEYAIAYYEYVDTNNDDIKDTKYGYRAKNTQAEAENDARCQHIELNYLVRPAEMATTLANASTYWNDKIKVIGFYAQALTRSASAYDFPLAKAFSNETFEGVIKDVTASNGILTVKVQNSNDYDLRSDFYNELISAKLALTIDIDETNFTTKYVQVFPKDSDPSIYAERVQLNVYQASLTTGAEFQLTSTLVPSNVTTPGVVWSSSNEAIATVDQNGLVTVNDSKDGEVTITCTANMPDVNGNVVSNSCDIDVVFAEPEVYIVSNATSVEVGSTVELKYAAYPAGAYNPSILEWTSSNNALATVDDKGVVTGVAYNNVAEQNADPVYEKVTITLTADGQYVATHELTVTPVFPKSIAFTDGFAQTIDMKIGEQKTFTAAISPNDAIQSAGNNIRWWIKSPSNQNAGDGTNSGDGGSYNFTPSEEGTYTITVKHTNSNFSYVYNVRYVRATPYYVTSIAFNDATHTMDQGDSWTPSLTVSPSNATYKGYTLTSSNTDLISVNGGTLVTNNDYTITGDSETVTITATATGASEGGTYPTATCQVTVKKVINIIGWYYCANNQCYETLDQVSAAGTTPVGVVYSMANPTGQDAALAADYSGCVHGYAVSFVQPTWQYYWQKKSPWPFPNSWINSNLPANYVGISDLNNTSVTNSKLKGYNNTQMLFLYQNYLISQNEHLHTDGSIILDFINAYNKYPNRPSAVDGSAGWFMPSIGDMLAIHEVYDIINPKITSAGGTSLSTYGEYWLSSINTGNISISVNPSTGGISTNGTNNTRGIIYVTAF